MTTYVKDGSGWQQLTGLDRPYANVGGVNISAAGYIPAYGTTLYGTSTPHGLNTGDIVTISGVTPSSFNTTAVANVFDSVQFYFTLFDGSTGGAYSSGGTTSTFKPVKNVYANVSGTWNETFSYFETSGGTSYFAGAGYTGVYFTANGTFTILEGTRNIEFAVVGGGGGGGGTGRSLTRNNIAYGGGGGAGGFVQSTSTNLTVGSYSITVGAGGTGGTPASTSFPSGVATGGNGTVGTASTVVFSGSTLVSSAGGNGGTGGRGSSSIFTASLGGTGGEKVQGTVISGGSGFSSSGGSLNQVNRGGGGGGVSGTGGNATSTITGEAGLGSTSPGGGWSPGVSFGGTGGDPSATYQYPYNGTGGNGSVGYASGSTGVSGYVYLRWLT